MAAAGRAMVWERAEGCAREAIAGAHRRREPEKTALWQLVARELEPLLSSLREGRPDGSGLPRYIEHELRGYLDCGILERGFARVRCGECGDELLVAFSCRGRGVCPSCTARRMCDTAAHLVDRVVPRLPMRQWVITFPRRVRWHLARDPKLATQALDVVLRVLFGWQRKVARGDGVVFGAPSRSQSARCGAVSFLQRFGSSLELNFHIHSLLPDGVFTRPGGDPDARPKFHELAPPADADVKWLLARIAERVTALLRRRGRLDDEDTSPPGEDDLPLLAALPAPRRSVPIEEKLPPLCARQDGFSLHAATALHANDRAGLERLARYCARPALSLDRLTIEDDGRVRYRMKRRFSDGTEDIVLPPREFLLRLCALVPSPRVHQVRYHGMFGPNARGRAKLLGRSAPADEAEADCAPTVPAPVAAAPAQGDPPPDPDRERRLPWAELLRRVHAVEVLVCGRCGGPMKILAFISDERVARHILDHLGFPRVEFPRARPPPPSQATLFPDQHIVAAEEELADPPSAFD
jgi:hypothetical protein